MKKRILSLCLAMVLALGLVTPALASPEPDAGLEATDVTVEGTNDVGDLLAGELHGRTVSNTGGNHISNLTVEGSAATVELVTDKAAEIVVAVYDESSGQMLASGNAPAAAGTETVSVTIEGTVPQYFIAKAFLLDAAGHEPLCEEYTTNLYTKEMQDFLDTDINDYDADRVLNLDGEPSTNFMVYSEKTIVVKENGQTNVLTDNGDGTYTVTNADETFTSLTAGDTFSYEQNDGTVKLVKVASASVEGTVVTIQEDDGIEMGDFFDLVKIEVGEEESESEVAPTAIIDTDKTVKKSVKVELGGKDSIMHMSGTLDVSLHLKLYATWTYHYAELTATTKLTASLSFTGKLELREFKMADLKFYPLPVLSIGIEPKFVVEASGKLDFSATIKSTLGFAIENFHMINKCKAPKVEYDIKLDAKLYIGIKMEPKVELLEGFAKVSASFGEGYEITASTSFLQDKGDERHLCTLCFDIKISKVTSLSGAIAFFRGFINYESKFEISDSLGEFYYSTDFEEFGKGTCPHKEYKIALTVVDESGKPVRGASIHRNGNHAFGDEEDPVTNEEGVAEFYLPNGKYSFTVTYKGSSADIETEINGKAVKLEVVLAASEPGTLASGKCGDNITWKITDDGVLIISGTGDMPNMGYSEGNEYPWSWDDYSGIWLYEYVTELIIEDGVTSIGDGAFFWFYRLKKATLPPSITNIGAGAFCFCQALESIVIPKGVKRIAMDTFLECESMTNITIPSSVTVIEEGAFWYCLMLSDVYYAGTKDQWESISIDRTLAVGEPVFYLDQATIHYQSTGPDDPGVTDAVLPEEPLPDATAGPGPEIEAVPEVTPIPESTPELTPVPELTPEPTPEATAEPEITPEPEATAEPESVPTTEAPEPTEEPPVDSGIEPVSASQERAPRGIVLVSAFSGSTDGQTALFTGLLPGEDYAIAVVLNASAADLLAPSNLLFIAQTQADEDGRVALAYVPRTNDTAFVSAYGPESTSAPPSTAAPTATPAPSVKPTVMPTQEAKPTPTKAPSAVPKTGDGAPLALYASLLVLCLGGLALTLYVKRRTQK